jgi:hypothetical protein
LARDRRGVRERQGAALPVAALPERAVPKGASGKPFVAQEATARVCIGVVAQPLAFPVALAPIRLSARAARRCSRTQPRRKGCSRTARAASAPARADAVTERNQHVTNSLIVTGLQTPPVWAINLAIVHGAVYDPED